MKRYKSVTEYIENTGEWEEAVILLREIFLSTELNETLKWSAPVYTINNKNVAGIGAFKAYVGIWFFQGSFLKDKKKKLFNAQEGKTKAMRQWRFTSVDEIQKEAQVIRDYIEEAIENQKQGKEIKSAKNKPLVIPEELQIALDKDPILKDHFDQFTLGKKREFTDHIGSAKQAETRQRRLEKAIPMIMNGIGLGDKYRK